MVMRCSGTAAPEISTSHSSSSQSSIPVSVAVLPATVVLSGHSSSGGMIQSREPEGEGEEGREVRQRRGMIQSREPEREGSGAGKRRGCLPNLSGPQLFRLCDAYLGS